MGGPARPLHEPGNHRSSERCSPRQSADCGSLTIPASPAGAHETSAALTPLLGARPTSLPAVAALRDQGLWPQPGTSGRLVPDDCSQETGARSDASPTVCGEQFRKALRAFPPIGGYIYPYKPCL